MKEQTITIRNATKANPTNNHNKRKSIKLKQQIEKEQIRKARRESSNKIKQEYNIINELGEEQELLEATTTTTTAAGRRERRKARRTARAKSMTPKLTVKINNERTKRRASMEIKTTTGMNNTHHHHHHEDEATEAAFMSPRIPNVQYNYTPETPNTPAQSIITEQEQEINVTTTMENATVAQAAAAAVAVAVAAAAAAAAVENVEEQVMEVSEECFHEAPMNDEEDDHEHTMSDDDDETTTNTTESSASSVSTPTSTSTEYPPLSKGYTPPGLTREQQLERQLERAENMNRQLRRMLMNVHRPKVDCPAFSTAKLKCRLVPPSDSGFTVGDPLRLYVENHNNCPISICLLFRPFSEATNVWLPARDLPLPNHEFMDSTTSSSSRGKRAMRASDYMAIYPNMTQQIRHMERDFHPLQSHEEIVLTIPTAKLPRIGAAPLGSRVQFMLLATTLKSVSDLQRIVRGHDKARHKVAHCSFSVAIKDEGFKYKLQSGLPLATSHGANKKNL